MLNWDPLTSTYGARLDGVDLVQDIHDVADDLLQLVHDQLVVVVPNQRMNNEEHARVMSRLGPLQPHPVSSIFGDDETIFTIEEGQIRPLVARDDACRQSFQTRYGAWHSDYTFCSSIPSIASLRGITLPKSGGDTLWANTATAWEGISPALQTFIVGLRARHVMGRAFMQNFPLAKYGSTASQRVEAEFIGSEHPVAIRHRVSGRMGLFVNPVYTMAVSGLNDRESNALLDFLFESIMQPSNVLRHHWSVDDFVLWDEQLTLHLAPTDFFPHRRVLVRVSSGSVKPESVRL